MSQSSSTTMISGLTILAVIGLFVLLVIFNPPVSTSPLSTRDLALTCTTDMATKFHIHPYVEIRINGELQPLPANIGITNGCMHPLHTHDEDVGVGKIHVESPEKRDFTLGDFFAVWGKTFNQNQILDYTTDETHLIRVTVNGASTQAFEDLVLKDDDKIVISYEEIPLMVKP